MHLTINIYIDYSSIARNTSILYRMQEDMDHQNYYNEKIYVTFNNVDYFTNLNYYVYHSIYVLQWIRV